ncbi:MAG TPA: redoxin domain-containing protein [Candidatus Acidoferrum sp.]|nr:redoxin domain-containing protein [Candidatus Acidoferrum sp.]
MGFSRLLLLFSLSVTPLLAQVPAEGPTSEKAQKSYKEALEEVHKRRTDIALDGFKKADKQDEGRCIACQRKMIEYGLQLQEWKTAQIAAEEMVAEAQSDKNIALAHFELGFVFLEEGLDKHKDELFTRAHEEFTKALAAAPNFPDAVFSDGKALAHLKQDDAAKAQFEKYVKMRPDGDPQRQRVLRYISEPGLARARMAPAFAVNTLDGQHISLDDLTGKVVLIDFWATWCGPCREALPHMQQIAKKFQGQPLVVLSVSLDSDEQKWKDFITKNGMTWVQYRDGGFTGPVANLFGVKAIPQTFTIDADGVLQDQHIGDASIEGKLKKLVARAQELQAPQKALQ